MTRAMVVSGALLALGMTGWLLLGCALGNNCDDCGSFPAPQEAGVQDASPD